MKSILIIGSYYSFTRKLINKLYIEKWRIYTLVKYKEKKLSEVFEQYVFDYSSDSIREIIRSCKPHVIIFTGAYDSSFNWNAINIKDTALKYIADLSNLLMSSSTQGVRRFIYLSSEIVFNNDYIVDIKEDMPVYPNSYMSMAISIGENMTIHVGQATQIDTSLVRLANLYDIPKNKESCNDTITKMCLEAATNRRLEVNAKRTFAPLYVDDAVEALYLLLESKKREHKIYHISSMDEVTEDKIAKLIINNYSSPIDIIDSTKGLSKKKSCRGQSGKRENY